MRKTFTLIAVLALALALTPGGVATAVTAGQPLVFHELTPCALFDTRPSQGGTGIMAAGESRTFHVVGSTSNFGAQGGTAGGCNIPGFSGGQPQTQMVYLNLVAIDPAAGGNLKVWATTDPEPAGGVVNYQRLTPNLNNSNSIVVGVRQDTEGDDITVKANVGSVHVRGVALGYLTTASNSFWALGGNSGTTGSQFLGTTDNQPLNLRVNDQRAFRLEPNATSPNVIGGFSGNDVTAGALGATIGGGGAGANLNRVTDDYGTVGGGLFNRAGNDAGTTSDRQYGTIGGGQSNTASGANSTVGGGQSNTAGGTWAVVGGGQSNAALNFHATVGGGSNNTAIGNTSTVGGGSNNTASAFWATVPGGSANTAAGLQSFAAGTRAKANHQGAFVWADSQIADFASTANDEFSVRAGGGVRFVVGAGGLRLEPNATSPNVIGGFSGNAVTAGALGATIGGGGAGTGTNRVTDDWGTVGGGRNNQAGDDAGTTTDRALATVGGGTHNTASGEVSTVGGGGGNTASGFSATVPGGNLNTAEGQFSFAAGRHARAAHDGAFVWGDSTGADVASSAVDEFTVRASGGTQIFSNSTLTTGVTLAPGGGSWGSVSDRAVKEDLRAVEPGEILAEVAGLPITTWRYESQDASIRHIGPTGQDFYAAFGVGEDERHITAVDADGVALAAIQGLDQKVEQENAELRSRLATVEGARTPGGIPAGAWWAIAWAIGLLGLGLGRRWGMAVVSR